MVRRVLGNDGYIHFQGECVGSYPHFSVMVNKLLIMRYASIKQLTF